MTAADRVIEAFGGVDATADALKVVRGTVLYWQEKGRVPAIRQPAIMAAARERGITINPADLVNTEAA